MKIEYDLNKNQTNIENRDIDFGENRYIAMGRIDDHIHVLVFTVRDEAVRIISLRKANKREVKNYEDEP